MTSISKNMLTVDLEDYFHSTNFDKVVGPDRWETVPHRIAESAPRLLDLLDRCSTKATFFVLGWIAQHYPSIVREVHKRGHEIATHGYWHRLVYSQTPDEFRADVRRSKAVVEDVAGSPVVAYRAPSFSITRKSLWALDVLREEGFLYDSSIFPVRHGRYGIPDAPSIPHRVSVGLTEVPPSTITLLGHERVGIAGGGYLRLLPFRALMMAYDSLVSSDVPLVLYVHPWEMDVDQPRFNLGPVTSARHYWGTRHVEGRMELILKRFGFGTIGGALP